MEDTKKNLLVGLSVSMGLLIGMRVNFAGTNNMHDDEEIEWCGVCEKEVCECDLDAN